VRYDFFVFVFSKRKGRGRRGEKKIVSGVPLLESILHREQVGDLKKQDLDGLPASMIFKSKKITVRRYSSMKRKQMFFIALKMTPSEDLTNIIVRWNKAVMQT
jgi:hypothetical protein